MECKAQGDDLNGCLETEYSNKVGLCVVLKKDQENQGEVESDTGRSFLLDKREVAFRS